MLRMSGQLKKLCGKQIVSERLQIFDAAAGKQRLSDNFVVSYFFISHNLYKLIKDYVENELTAKK